MKVPYIDLGIQHQKDKTEILAEISSLLDSGMFVLGEHVEAFEKKFAELSDCKYAVGVANGTDSLILSLKALGIGKGDEVITAPNSFLASASSIALVGATPVFADVCDDFNIDPKEIERKISKRTKAIIPVHLTGRPAKMDEIISIAKSHDLAIIEDAAQAVGAKFNNKSVGAFGDFGSFSLHPLKNLSAVGDAGIITTNSEEHYQWLLKARTHGMKNRDECEFWSINSRLDALQAAILNVKIKRLPEWTARRRQIAKMYSDNLADLVQVPIETEKEFSVYHTFIIQTDRRDELQNFLKENGIDSKVHYPIAIHQQGAAHSLGYKYNDFPVTERQIKRILSLPIYPDLSDDSVEYVINKIKRFFQTLK